MKIKNIKYELLNSVVNYRLNDKKIYLYHNGLSLSKSPLNIGIDLIIKDNGLLDNSLNINIEKQDQETYLINYPDESYDTLDILYYYLNDNNVRIYVDKDDVTIYPDGKMEYDGHIVKTYYKNDNGLTLTGDYEDFINSENISFKNEDLENLEQEVININGAIKDLEYQNSEYGKVFDNDYITYINKQNDIEQSSYEILDLQVSLNASNLSDTNSLFTYKGNLYNTEPAESDPDETWINYLNYNIDKRTWDKQKDINAKNSEIKEDQNVLLSKKDILEQRYNTIRDTYYSSSIQKNNQLISYYNKLKTLKEYELNKYRNQVPVLFLINSDKTLIYGFNEYNKLCIIFDNNGNQQIFDFENNNLISITSNDNKKIELKYNSNNKLISIINDVGTIININYDNNKVSSISSDEDETNITYYNDKLDEIIDNGNIGYKIYRNNYITRIDKINSNNNSKELHNYTYNNNVVTIVDKTRYVFYNNEYIFSKLEYIFDYNNSLLTEVEIKNNKIINISGYEYNSDHCNFTFNTNYKDEVIYSRDGITFTSQKGYLVTLPTILKTDYTLYAILRASSLQNINEYRTTSYCSHIYNESNIKYEIRVKLTYPGEIIIYGASLNPNIIGEQLVALPVTLKEDEYGKAIRPNSTVIYFDYSNNSGNCEIVNFALADCEYQYIENDRGKYPKELWNSDLKYPLIENGSEIGYVIKSNHIEYKYNINELKEEEISYINYEQYDTNNVLINNVEKTLSKKYYYDNNSNIIKIVDSNNNVLLYEYDDNGNNVKKVSYNLKDSSNKIIEESTYKEDGTLSSFKNELGYEIKHNDSLNESFITSPNGFIISLDNNSIKSDLLSHSNIIKNGKLDNQILGNMKYSYTYDEWGYESSLSINDNIYMTFEYNEYLGNKYYISKLNDNTGYIKITDMYDKLCSVIRLNGETQEVMSNYHYDEDRFIGNSINGNFVYYRHYIDDVLAYDVLSYIDNFQTEHIKYYSYDIYGNISKISYDNDNYNYSYNEDNNISGLVHNDYQENIIYDSINRIKELNSNIILKNYEYLNINNRATNLIKNHKLIIDNRIINNKFDYDKCGNIIKSNINHNEDRYYYDDLNRIIRCDLKELNHTYTYEYDINNNIISKGIHDLSNDNNLYNSTYIDYNYDKDNKLISYDNYQITYDNSFRPTNYKNNNLVWFNNKLLSYGDNQYEYDFNGLRNKKITSNGTYEYIRDDDKLIKETITLGTGINGGITGGSSIGNSVSTITYNYGLNGIIGFTLESNNTTKDYYYVKNIFNDVIEIIDDNYITYAKYSYDVFGKCNIITNVDDIANINPIRYRSYYYDNETGLYYLNTRYYDPETMRFISLDGIEYLDYDTLGGLNLFVYCNNNPIMNVDPNGTFGFLASLIVGVIIGTISGGASTFIIEYKKGTRGKDLVLNTIGGALIGGALGAATVLGGAAGLASIGVKITGYNLGMISSAMIATGSVSMAYTLDYIMNAINRNDFSVNEMFVSAAKGLEAGLITFGVSYIGGKLGFFNNMAEINTVDFYNKTGFTWPKFIVDSIRRDSRLNQLIVKTIFVSGVAWLIRKLLKLDRGR